MATKLANISGLFSLVRDAAQTNISILLLVVLVVVVVDMNNVV